jgi:hypothetical protein
VIFLSDHNSLLQIIEDVINLLEAVHNSGKAIELIGVVDSIFYMLKHPSTLAQFITRVLASNESQIPTQLQQLMSMNSSNNET